MIYIYYIIYYIFIFIFLFFMVKILSANGTPERHTTGNGPGAITFSPQNQKQLN